MDDESKEVELAGCSWLLLYAVFLLVTFLVFTSFTQFYICDDLRAIQRALDAYGIVAPEETGDE